ncbi:RING-H2 finger protein ATL80 [Striga hermonthica]|uniref:RING-H2 finger protein ATL80 n=1 Tax=Striga hermonthica TaxID=68872 RepID=A0A9N7NJ95_STRHE|nr:RING-H2 finger protein ATL80 [Striga hermonthica]
MTTRSRHLTGFVFPPSSLPPMKEAPAAVETNNSYVLFLAFVLFPLIGILVIVIRQCCCWIRRLSPITAAPHKGLKVLKALPKMTLGEEEVADCAICLGEFVAGEEIRVLPQCKHAFHVTCINTWLRSQSSCPCCRAILV